MINGVTTQAVEFLRRVYPTGPWTLTAIIPDGETTTRTFLDGQVDALFAWVEQRNGRQNIYWQVNPVRSPVFKKASRTDILSVNYLHVDIDPAKDQDLASEREAILADLRNPSMGLPTPSIVVDSGGGYQAFWALKDPIELDGSLADAEKAKLRNLFIERAFRADHCHNIDRLMRLPGTVNLPNAKKTAAGRSATLASVVWHRDDTFPTDVFPEAVVTPEEIARGLATREAADLSGGLRRLKSVDELDEWQVPGLTKSIIVQGQDLDDPNDDDSSLLYRVLRSLLWQKVPDQVILGVVTDRNFDISRTVLSEKHIGERGYAKRQLEKAKAAVTAARASGDESDAGGDAPAAPDIREGAPVPSGTDRQEWLTYFNSKYAVIKNYYGKCRVVHWGDEEGQRSLFDQSFETFRDIYRNRKVMTGTNKDGLDTFKPAGSWWLDHLKRRDYDRVEMNPKHTPHGSYNMWAGFGVDPAEGDRHTLFLEHVRDNLCSGDARVYEYVLNWMARAVQMPWEPGQVALVLHGQQGTGKGVFAQVFGSLFGPHYRYVANTKHLTGNFNKHLRDCVFLFSDEAFYAGDKAHQPILNSLITEPRLTIEGKGVDTRGARNFLHIVMASNRKHVIPADAEERRYMVMEVSSRRIQDKAYFKAIKAATDAGGAADLLGFLLRRNIEGFEVRDVPQTAALQEQKLQSLTADEQWWYESLSDGRFHARYPSGSGGACVPREEMHMDYQFFCREQGVRTRRLSSEQLGKLLRDLVPEGQYAAAQKRGSRLMRNPDGTFIRAPDGSYQRENGRFRTHEIPSLDTLRAHWDKKYRTMTSWPEPMCESDQPGPEAF